MAKERKLKNLIGVRFSDEEMELLKRVAQERRWSLAAVIRFIVFEVKDVEEWRKRLLRVMDGK